jgi:hypothetical protein
MILMTEKLVCIVVNISAAYVVIASGRKTRLERMSTYNLDLVQSLLKWKKSRSCYKLLDTVPSAVAFARQNASTTQISKANNPFTVVTSTK